MTRIGRRWLHATIGAVVVLLVVGRWAAGATASRLWAGALGVTASHAGLQQTATWLQVGALAGAILWFVGNLYVVYRGIGAVHVPRRVGNLQVAEAVPRRILLGIVAVVGVGLGIAFGHRAGGWWAVRTLASHDAAIGISDPVLGRDVAFYLFTLPWLRAVHGFATWCVGAIVLLAVFLYGAVGALRWRRRRLAVRDLARWHLAGLLAVFAAVLAWGYRLEPAEYVAMRDVPFDAVLTEVRIPVARTLTWVAAAAGAAAVAWIRVPRAPIVAVPWALLGAASLVGHHLVPGFAGAMRVAGEARAVDADSLRAPWLEMAYGIPRRETALDATVLAEPIRTGTGARALAVAPVWDGFAVGVALDRLGAGPAYVRYAEAGLGLYRSGSGEPVPVYVAARRIDVAAAGAAGEDLAWSRVHRSDLAAARGAVAVLAHRAASAGLPLFAVDLAQPDVLSETLSDVALREEVLWMTPGQWDFALVPGDSGGPVGVAVDGLFRRLALAWALQSPALLSPRAAAGSSRVVWHRDPTGRLEQYAPFADFAPAGAVVAEGRLVWVAVGTVTSPTFPLSSSVRWRGGTVRYARPGLVGTVDAVSGATAVYLMRDADPLSAAWAEILPDLVRPFASLPAGLRENVAYPATLLEAQAELVLRGGAAEPAALDGPRTHLWVGSTLADSALRLRRVALLEEEQGTAAVGLLDGSVRDGHAVLERYRFVPPPDIPGTATTTRRLDRVRGDVPGVQGPVRWIPVEEGALALQATYEAPDEGFGALRLVDVAVAWGAMAAHGASLEEALARLRSGVTGDQADGAGWVQARRWFERLDAARRTGDWVAFGRAYEELQRLLTGTPDTVR